MNGDKMRRGRIVKVSLILLICFMATSSIATAELTDEDLLKIREIVDESNDRIYSWLRWGFTASLIIPTVMMGLAGTLLVYILQRETKKVEQYSEGIKEALSESQRVIQSGIDVTERATNLTKDYRELLDNSHKLLDEFIREVKEAVKRKRIEI